MIIESAKRSSADKSPTINGVGDVSANWHMVIFCGIGSSGSTGRPLPLIVN